MKEVLQPQATTTQPEHNNIPDDHQVSSLQVNTRNAAILMATLAQAFTPHSPDAKYMPQAKPQPPAPIATPDIRIPRNRPTSVAARPNSAPQAKRPDLSDFSNLLSRIDFDPQISRKDIPAKLGKLIQGFGTVLKSPENYDPKKPNFYIVGVEHVFGADDYKNFYPTQADALRIFHMLFALGAKRQLLEGKSQGFEIEHNQEYPYLDESPITALPKYRKEGKIKRANTAAEAIYGADLKSIGIENPEDINLIAKYYQIMNTGHQHNGDIFTMLSRLFGLEIDPSKSNEELRKSILSHFTKLSAEKQIALQTEVVSHPTSKYLLNLAANAHYLKIIGRNNDWAKKIPQLPKADTTFLVGVNHCTDLSEKLASSKAYNTFIILPNKVDPKSAKVHYHNWKYADFMQAVVQDFLYTYGLHEKKFPTDY